LPLGVFSAAFTAARKRRSALRGYVVHPLDCQMNEKIPSLNDLTREMPSGEEWTAVINSIDELHARAAALILSAFIDNWLEKAISLSFVPLGSSHFNRIFRNPRAPLSDLSSKIMLAFALGILNQEQRSQADRIRSIRNTFAHSVKPIDFDHPTIKAECEKLDPKKLVLPNKRYVPRKDTGRERFTASATLISTSIMRYVKARTRAVPVFWSLSATITVSTSVVGDVENNP
jgi:hypothetical protein